MTIRRRSTALRDDGPRGGAAHYSRGGTPHAAKGFTPLAEGRDDSLPMQALVRRPPIPPAPTPRKEEQHEEQDHSDHESHDHAVEVGWPRQRDSAAADRERPEGMGARR